MKTNSHSALRTPHSEIPARGASSIRSFQFSILNLKLPRLAALLALISALGLPPSASILAAPVVTNFTTSIYAVVPDPLALSFAADGTLYVGRDASGSGGGSGDAVKVHRVAPGGSPVTEYGDLAISDPDALIVDLAGVVSGTPGAVLVGGVHPGGTTGKISKINTNGTVTTLFGPNTDLLNPSDFVFDQSGRLLITENNNGKVLVTTGAAPTTLFTLAQASRIAVDALNRIVVSTSASGGGPLRLYTSGGALSNASFATVRANSPLARGPGGRWGTDIYAVAPNGDLIRLGLDGTTNKVGSGFADISNFTFGPDGALYASQFNADCIYRFAIPAVPDATTTIYARMPDPVRLAFAPDGTLFVSRDNSGSGGDNNDAVKIHRVGPGGSPVTEYGDAPITDPDAIAYDWDGSASGIAGAVIVAGTQSNNLTGKIVAIRPDQTLTNLYGPTAFNFNPNVFIYDLTGRLLFSDDVGGKVWVLTNGVPAVLFNLTEALFLEADALNRLVVGVDGSGPLRLYSASGGLLTNRFATVADKSPLARGPGGFWGTGLFCVNTNGDLLSLDTNGLATTRGTGFGLPWGMSFGPDGALYVCEFGSDLIWRIRPDVPRLAIRHDGASVVVSWLNAFPDWKLEWTDALAAGALWEVIEPPYATNATDFFHTEAVPAPTGAKFYRLHKP